MTVSAAHKYLARGAEVEARELPAPREGRWRQVVVVPCRDEAPGRVARLRAWLAGHAPDSLLIVVSNGPAGEPRSEESRLLAAGARPVDGATMGELAWLPGEGCASMLVERCGIERGIPADEGVGRARKLGGDLALALWLHGVIEQPWIHYTDADATPSPAIATMRAAKDTVAVVWPFRHVPCADEVLHRGHLQHEIWMRWWVRGLEYARSPFAYHTIGSCVSVHMEAYAHARGVPSRAAGEDFHLLRKLAKLGTVIRDTGPTVDIESRASARVPFGTGPAAARMRMEPATWRLSRPAVFEDLGRWLRVMEKIARAEPDVWSPASDARSRIEAAITAVMGPAWHTQLARVSRGEGGDLRAHQWFDGLKTLRFVHALERHPALATCQGAQVLGETHPVDLPVLESVCTSLWRAEQGFTKEVGRPRMCAGFREERDCTAARWMADGVIAEAKRVTLTDA